MPPSCAQLEGRFAIVTIRRRGLRWTLRRQVIFHRRKRLQRTAKSCGPGAATLALRCGVFSASNGGKKGRSPGRARISRKAIARGKPGCLGCTCQNRVHSFSSFSTRRCGRSRRPAFPAPSFQERDNEDAQLGRKSRCGNERVCFNRHCEERSDEAIHISASGEMDCFASLAMTAGTVTP